jgi:hypothetical protein
VHVQKGGIFFLLVLGFELSALHLLGQVCYHLSHAPTPLCFSYFSESHVSALLSIILLFMLLE